MVISKTFKSKFLAESMLVCTIVLMSPCLLLAQVSVTTYHSDLARTGQNLNEPVLTPANVNLTSFGKLFSYQLDGQVYTQPLYMPNITIPNNGVHNVVYLATEHDSVYAFDADNNTGGNAIPLWQVSFINPPTVTTIPSSDYGTCTDLHPEIGITGTPVIDPSTGTMYLLARTKENGNYLDRLHALDIATGAEKFGGPVEVNASVPGTGGGGTTVVLDNFTQNQRAGLVLQNGQVYIGFSLLCSAEPFYGWLLAYDAHTLQQTAAWNSTANGSHGGIWAGGSAPAVDSSGNTFLATGDGTFDAYAGGSDYGSSIVKLPLPTANWAPTDYFTPYDFNYQNEQNLDLGSAGVVLMPDQPQGPHQHLLFMSGKEGTIYLVDRDQMGHFHHGKDSQIVESLPAALVGGQWGSPAWWNNYAYFSGAHDVVKGFGFDPITGLLSTTPVSQSPPSYLYFNGSTPVISANQNNSAILWAAENHDGQATMHAYDATALDTELFNTRQNPTRDGAGTGVRFMVPTIADGKVYLATNFRLGVYGLFTFRPSSVAFPTQLAGTTSATRTVTLTNPNIALMNITSIATTGEFQLSGGTCPISGGQLAPGTNCTIGVQFVPQGGGIKSGNVNVALQGQSPITVPLTGTGKSLTFAPNSMNWAVVLVGHTSVPKLLTVNIFGKDPTTFNSVNIGTDSAEYAISSNTCIGSFTGPSQCTIYVTFTPNYSGTRSGTLNLSDTSGNQVINLTGTGEGVGLSATFLGFGKVKVGGTSAPKTLTAQVLGKASATFGSISLNGANPGDYSVQSDTCSNQTIPGGGSCQVVLVFKPSLSGTRTANLNVPNNDGPSPLVVKLSGTGQ